MARFAGEGSEGGGGKRPLRLHNRLRRHLDGGARRGPAHDGMQEAGEPPQDHDGGRNLRPRPVPAAKISDHCPPPKAIVIPA